MLDCNDNVALSAIRDKVDLIECCLADEKTNLWELRELAISRGGLVNAEFRQQIWKELVGLGDEHDAFSSSGTMSSSPCSGHQSKIVADDIDDDDDDHESDEKDDNNKRKNNEVDLIRRDVGRSVLFRYRRQSPVSVTNMDGFPTEKEGTLGHVEGMLASVLEATVSTPLAPGQTKPFYYQGLHDIAGVLLHNLDYDAGATTAILRRLCRGHLRDAVRESFGNVSWLLDTFSLSALQTLDSEVHAALVSSEVHLSHVALPWLITWCTHDAHDEIVASRLLDAFIASHPLFPFYVSLALLIHPNLRQYILTEEYEQVSMHIAIQALPSRIRSDWFENNQNNGFATAQQLIDVALQIMRKIPPRSLLDLVDKTTNNNETLLTNEDLHKRANSIAFLKAPPSWTFKTIPANIQCCRKLPTTGQLIPLHPTKRPLSCMRAKLASGVKVIMSTVETDELQHDEGLFHFEPKVGCDNNSTTCAPSGHAYLTANEKFRALFLSTFLSNSPAAAEKSEILKSENLVFLSSLFDASLDFMVFLASCIDKGYNRMRTAKK